MAQLINLSVLNALYPMGGTANIEQAFSGTGAAPFSVTVPANGGSRRCRLFRWPFITSLPAGTATGYGLMPWWAWALRNNQQPGDDRRDSPECGPAQTLALLETLFAGNSPLSGALVGGQIATAAELKQRAIKPGRAALMSGYRSGVAWKGASARVFRPRSIAVTIRSRWHLV